MKILFIVPYPQDSAPSQRFRFEQYLIYLNKKGVEFKFVPFLDLETWNILYKKGNYQKKIKGVLLSYLKRIALLFTLKPYNYIFIHREATPYGPPFIELIITKVLKKKIIYDFDDAIWLTDKTSESVFSRVLKWRSKVRWVCKWSYKVSCGNAYLANFAANYNTNVLLNPTTIDTENMHNPELLKKGEHQKVFVGWTGTHSTIKYLEPLLPWLTTLQKRLNFELLVISDVPPKLYLENIRFIKWSKEQEIEDLFQIDIGIMPLPDDIWARGKCGFKALQYMALKIPAVISPVGVNKAIVSHGKDGYLCSSKDEWMECLSKLIVDHELRKKLGENGRKKIVDNYSVLSNSDNFFSLFDL